MQLEVEVVAAVVYEVVIDVDLLDDQLRYSYEDNSLEESHKQEGSCY